MVSSPSPPPSFPLLIELIPSLLQSMNIDRPLDEVIQEKRKSRGPRRARQPRAPAAEGTDGAAAPAAAPRQPRQPRNANVNAQSGAAASAAGGQEHVGDKVIISGLPDDVNENQIRVRSHCLLRLLSDD
jgi:hypothetical protein